VWEGERGLFEDILFKRARQGASNRGFNKRVDRAPHPVKSGSDQGREMAEKIV
jgi:hypothetical protein